ncbi:hypothetical protein [Fluviispira multicolorata]|uniref:Uncharacterized protein n=1 Tax=Fluviispira multicolorata TaxID=2654512 RepID=A0A833N596_9BACT|nr:hypothetical protein [Fluviispira multicolorata]KAB8033592.1 hypothetical protein GCL57_02470 [Fluviispira multicolorata]
MQAAMQVAKSRQAIENLIKKNVIEHKQIGDKKITHVYIPSLLMHYASKKNDANCISTSTKLDASDFRIELALANAECKRLSDLLAIYEKNLTRTESELLNERRELLKERERNIRLQHEVLTLTKEFKAILNNEDGLSNIIKKLFNNKKNYK